MKILNLLYYIVYKVFKLIPRREPIDHVLASSFLAILLTTNIFTGLFLSGFAHYLINQCNVKSHWLVILIFIGCYFLNNWYFIKTENYKRIINIYDEKFKNQLLIVVAVGIIYIIGTFLGFWALAFYFNKM